MSKTFSKPPAVDSGWHRDKLPELRRSLILKEHGGDILAAAQALQKVSVTAKNSETRRIAAIDAAYLLKKRYQRQTAYYPVYQEVMEGTLG